MTVSPSSPAASPAGEALLAAYLARPGWAASLPERPCPLAGELGVDNQIVAVVIVAVVALVSLSLVVILRKGDQSMKIVARFVKNNI